MRKPKPIATVPQKAFFLFICTLVGLIAIFLIFRLFSGGHQLLKNDNVYYSEAYRPKIEQAQEMRRMEALQKKQDEESSNYGDEDKPSNQPVPIGFKEQEINKTKGDRYRTW